MMYAPGDQENQKIHRRQAWTAWRSRELGRKGRATKKPGQVIAGAFQFSNSETSERRLYSDADASLVQKLMMMGLVSADSLSSMKTMSPRPTKRSLVGNAAATPSTKDSVSKIATLRSGGLISTTHREFLRMGTRWATMCPAHHVDVVDLIEAAVPVIGSTLVAPKARIAVARTGSRSDEGGKVFSHAY